jgi:hypothetical protein
MRGRGRKLVAIQTEAHACQQQSLVVCLAGSASASLSAQPPKSECVQQLVANIRSCPTFLAIVLTSSSNMTRARSAAVSLGGGSRPSVGLKTACLGLDCHEFSSAPSRTKACKRLVNTFFAWTYVPSQGADDDLRGAQADRVEPAHGVLPNPRALQVVYTKRPHDCDQPEHPPMTVCAHDIVGLGRVVDPTRPRPGHPPTDSLRAGIAGWHRATAI